MPMPVLLSTRSAPPFLRVPASTKVSDCEEQGTSSTKLERVKRRLLRN